MSKSKAYWALTATCLLWGSTWVVAKIAIQHVPVFQMTCIRQLIAGVLILAFHIPTILQSFNLKRFWRNLYTGFFLITLSNGLSTFGIKYIPSGLGALIGCFFPIILVLANYIIYRKKVPLSVILSMVLALVGVGIIFSDNVLNLFNSEYITGISLCLMAVVTWTIGTMINHKRTSSEENPDNTENIYANLGWQMLTSGITTFIIAHLFFTTIPVIEFTSTDWLSIAYLILFGSIISFLSYIYVLKTLPIQIGSVYAYINPIVAMFLGFLLLNETINQQIIIGTIVTLVGVFLVKYLSEKSIQS